MKHITINTIKLARKLGNGFDHTKLSDKEFEAHAKKYGKIYNNQKAFIKMYNDGRKLNPQVDVLRIINPNTVIISKEDRKAIEAFISTPKKLMRKNT